MPRFFAGDELGSIKAFSYSRAQDGKSWQCDTRVLLEGSSSGVNGLSRSIQKLALSSNEDSTLLVTARADGSATIFGLTDQDTLKEQSSWQETRLKTGQRYVGLSLTQRGVYSCTSNGALRLTKPGEDNSGPEAQLAALPSRLSEWRLTTKGDAFAYAGHEIELSIWDTERAFSSGLQDNSEGNKTSDSSETPSKKRKRNEQLLPGEIWRAKNLSNDSLNLRQPVRNTAFAYLQESPSPSQQHLLVGTQFGDVRRYDTRAARRPVSNWKGVGKTGGIGVIENGETEHQVFVSDKGCSLYALDLRNGKISYGYKGFAGAVTSLAAGSSLLVSGAEDRYIRLHSTFPPPAHPGQQQEHKGEVLDKNYVKVVTTVVAWDEASRDSATREHVEAEVAEQDDGDDVWEKMEQAESDEEHPSGRKKTRAK